MTDDGVRSWIVEFGGNAVDKVNSLIVSDDDKYLYLAGLETNTGFLLIKMNTSNGITVYAKTLHSAVEN